MMTLAYRVARKLVFWKKEPTSSRKPLRRLRRGKKKRQKVEPLYMWLLK